MTFDPIKFAAATHKLHAYYGDSEDFTREFGRLFFRHLGPKQLRMEEVAIRVVGIGDEIQGEMFVLGGGLMTVTVKGTDVKLDYNRDIDELAKAPSWVSSGDRFHGDAAGIVRTN